MFEKEMVLMLNEIECRQNLAGLRPVVEEDFEEVGRKGMGLLESESLRRGIVDLQVCSEALRSRMMSPC